MAETPDVNIRFRVRGARRIDQALRGVRTNIQKLSKDQRNDAKKTEREVAQAARRRTSKEAREAQRAADEVEKAERKKRKSYKQTAREEEQNERQAERRHRRRRRRGRGGGGMLAGAGAVAGAALLGARMAGQTAQGVIGVRSQQDVLSSMMGARANLVRNIIQGLRATPGSETMVNSENVPGLTNYMVGRAAQVGVDRGVSTEEIINAMANSQTDFSQFQQAFTGGKEGIDRLMEQFDFMAMVSQATGTSVEDTAKASFALMRALNVGADEVDEALSIIAQGALDGSISLNDFANQFPEILSSYHIARGTTGLEAVSEFSALMQALQSGGMTSPEKIRTAAERLLADLSTKSVQDKLRQRRNGGIRVLDENRNVRPLGELVSEIQAANLDPTQMNNIFSQEAARAVGFLRTAETNSGLTLQQRIDSATPELGRGLLEGSFDAVMNDAVGAGLDARAEREANMAVATEELIERFSTLASILGELEDRFPTASIMSGAIGYPLAALGGALGLKAMMGGGGSSMLASMGAGIKGLFSVAGMGALAAKAGVITVGTAVGGALGYGIGGISDAIEGTRGTSSGLQAAQREAFGLIDFEGGLATAIVEGIKELRAGPTLPERPSERGGLTIELGQRSINGIAQAAANTASGSGRRAEGGPTERTP